MSLGAQLTSPQTPPTHQVEGWHGPHIWSLLELVRQLHFSWSNPSNRSQNVPVLYGHSYCPKQLEFVVTTAVKLKWPGCKPGNKNSVLCGATYGSQKYAISCPSPWFLLILLQTWLVFIPAFYSFFYGGTLGTYLSLHFSVRARALSSLLVRKCWVFMSIPQI